MANQAIAVFGLGFVGLTTALGFCAKTNCKVYGLEQLDEKLVELQNNKVFFEEPKLQDALVTHNQKNFFPEKVSVDILRECSIFFLCVGTPCDMEGKADLSDVKKSVIQILSAKTEKKTPFTIVIKSTVPPGTVSDVVAPLCEKEGFSIGKDIVLCSNPEFLREGKAWNDFICPDRIVIGTHGEGSIDNLMSLYENFSSPVINVNSTTAEFIKYSSNTLLATLISFSNELSMIADKIGDIDVTEAFRTLHMDKRWCIDNQPVNMTTYAFPGCGFGGYCLPKDTQAMIARARESNCEATILKAVLTQNRVIKESTARKIIDLANGRDVGILGLSFNAGSDDVRNSPAEEIISILVDAGLSLYVYDPISMENFKKNYDYPLVYCESGADLIGKTKVVAILTAWQEFKTYDYDGVELIDGRYLLNT